MTHPCREFTSGGGRHWLMGGIGFTYKAVYWLISCISNGSNDRFSWIDIDFYGTENKKKRRTEEEGRGQVGDGIGEDRNRNNNNKVMIINKTSKQMIWEVVNKKSHKTGLEVRVIPLIRHTHKHTESRSPPVPRPHRWAGALSTHTHTQPLSSAKRCRSVSQHYSHVN